MNEQKFDDAGRSGRFNPGRIGRSLRPVIGRNAAWMVLVIGTITSLATLLFFLSAAQTNLRERFNNEVNQIQNLLQRRLIAHEMVLRGGAGLFDSQIEVDRNEWKQYIAALDLDRNYPGVLGVGFSKRIRAEDRAEHEDAIRSEGFADYAIRPAGERAEYTSIIYLETHATWPRPLAARRSRCWRIPSRQALRRHRRPEPAVSALPLACG